MEWNVLAFACPSFRLLLRESRLECIIYLNGDAFLGMIKT